MRKRRLFWLLWLLAAAGLYFFENNTGTRIVFAASILIPAFSIFCAASCSLSGKVRVEAPASLMKGSEAVCGIRITGGILRWFCMFRGSFAAENPLCGDHFETEAEGRDPLSFRMVPSHCGCVHLRMKAAAFEDVFGLWRFPLQAAAEHEILILPQLFPVQTGFPESGKSEGPSQSGNSRVNASMEYSGIREYVPGDPVRMIHWKLSAKTDRLLLREADQGPEGSLLLYLETTRRQADPDAMNDAVEAALSLSGYLAGEGIPHVFGWFDHVREAAESFNIGSLSDHERAMNALLRSGSAVGTEKMASVPTGEQIVIDPDDKGSYEILRRKKERNSVKAPGLLIRPDEKSTYHFDRTGRWLLLIMGILCAVLILIPGPRNSGMALLNRLFDASERVNAYRYDRLPVSGDPSIAPAAVLLSVMAVLLLSAAIFTGDPLLIGILTLTAAGGQAYFGLTIPGAANAALFGLLGMLLVRKKAGPGAYLFFWLVLAISAAAVILWRPGTDLWLEERSELVRDRISLSTVQNADDDPNGSGEIPETRHVHSRSLIQGDNVSEAGRSFHPVTEGEEQVSLPEWLTVLGGVIPLIPVIAGLGLLIFLMIRLFRGVNGARQFAKHFDSGDNAESVRYLFRRITDWLDSFGLGAGNLPYREWIPALSGKLPEAYVGHFADAVDVFEEAVYSGHELRRDQRDQVRGLLDETESLLYEKADLKKKFRLRFVEFLKI